MTRDRSLHNYDRHLLRQSGYPEPIGTTSNGSQRTGLFIRDQQATEESCTYSMLPKNVSPSHLPVQTFGKQS